MKLLLKIKRVFEAYLDEMNVITILLPRTYFDGKSRFFSLCRNDSKWELEIVQTTESDHRIKYVCKINTSLEFGAKYQIIDEHGSATDLQVGAVIRTQAFDEAFVYNGDDLGITYTKNDSTFNVWAPTATFVKLKLIYSTGDFVETHKMTRLNNGVWSLTMTGDLEGVYYTYLVCVNLVWNEAVDPYANSVTVNGDYGVVIDINKTRKQKPSLPILESVTDAIIYETHIRDFSIQAESGIIHKGKYLGLSELGTEGPSGTLTGLSYLLYLGITHVELLPFNDFLGVNEHEPEKEYNWGYNPLHYNVPDGSYCTDPYNPYTRIEELKQAIHVVHQQGLRIIMDVVYNHVYIREKSSFEKIVPGYYFRHDEHGMPSDGTGVGNDVASERLMVRKFIVDSVLFWLKEYHIDGFRFDLMGILDVDTINAIRRAVDEIDPSVILLGEGWDLNTPLPRDKKAIIANASKMQRIAQFNDRFRDGVKGSTFNLYDRGFALGNSHKSSEVQQTIAGSICYSKGKKGLFVEPTQSVNYVESHDNHTLWDKMAACNAHEEDEIRRKRQRLATTIVLLSQGIPFLHSGQEFYRTKQGVENSYKSSDDINMLDWKRKEQYEQDVQYIKGMISLRKSHQAFRFSSSAFIRRHLQFFEVPKTCIAYMLKNVNEFGPWNNIFVVHNNNNYEAVNIELPGSGIWEVVCNEQTSGVLPLSQCKEGNVTIEPISSIVLYQK